MLYFARLKQFQLLARILEQMSARLIIPNAVMGEMNRKLLDFSNARLIDESYASQIRQTMRYLTERGVLNSFKLDSDIAVSEFAVEIRRKLAHSSFHLTFDYGEAYAIFVARQVGASTVVSDDAVVPFVVRHVIPQARVEGSPYLVKYGFLKKLINYSAFVRLLFDLQEKAGYRYLNLYDPRKRRVFEMYRDNILDGVHLVKREIADCLIEGNYQAIISRLDGDLLREGTT